MKKNLIVKTTPIGREENLLKSRKKWRDKKLLEIEI